MTEHPTMPGSVEHSIDDDDLSRQRRKREARLLDRQLPDVAGVTLADVVADVLAASDEGRAPLDVPRYLAERGHTWMTITTVVDYLQRQRPASILRAVPADGSPRLIAPSERRLADESSNKPSLNC